MSIFTTGGAGGGGPAFSAASITGATAAGAADLDGTALLPIATTGGALRNMTLAQWAALQGSTVVPAVLSPAYFVSPAGNDANAGTQAAPFLTLTKAQSMMAGASTTKTTYVRGGTYTITSTWALTSADNGTAYIAYPGEVAVITTTTLNTVITATSVDGLKLQGLSFTGAVAATDKAHVELYTCSNCSVFGNHFANNGNGGLLLAGTTNSTVSGNQFDTHGIVAIEIKDNANYNLIDSNKIVGVNNASAPTTGGGIYGHGVNYNVISHNDISNCQGCGISVANFDGPAAPIYTLNQHNDVLYNVVRNTCTAAGDSGAIYTVGRAEADTFMRIMGNLVDGVSSSVATPHVLGIYLDDEANGVLVQDNIVRGVVGSNVAQFHAGKNCTMQNNIFDFSAGAQGILFQDASYANSTQTAALGTIGPNNAYRNIFWSSSGSLTPYVDLTGGTRVITGNLYPTGTTLTAPNTDSAPQYGNPAFVNPAAGDYTLGAGSAASLISFQPIDQTRYGLKPKTPHWY